jgi:hypothetical protein
MSPNLLEPRRLRENPERPSSIEGRLARQLRTLSVYAPVPQLRRYSAMPRRRRFILATVRLAAVVTLVLAVSGIAAATGTYVFRRVWSRPAEVAPPAGTHSQQVRHPRRKEAPAEPAARLPEPEIAALTVATAATASPDDSALRPIRKLRPLGEKHSDTITAPPTQPDQSVKQAPPTPVRAIEPPTLPASPSLPLPARAVPTGSSALGPSVGATSQVRTDGVTQEAELLRQALSALRRDHDAKHALALLDDYDRHFGQGALALEATSARAQALLQLGDNAHALELLDRLPLRQEGHTGELRVIRGELRSLSGRCPDALLDFDAVLSAPHGNAADKVGRALFGRASCRARTGDLLGAEQDRQRYLKEFPQGPAAERLLSAP